MPKQLVISIDAMGGDHGVSVVIPAVGRAANALKGRGVRFLLHGDEHAIEQALAQPPDLLLLDMHLGDMNGTDVSDALRQHAQTAHIPRVALSADVMPDQVNLAKSRGFLEYLNKPLQVAQLLKVLDRCEQP